jgi:acetyl esterase/lipase
MIHGGGHVTLSRRAVRPAQTRYLLELGILPVSIDYRLCPEVNLVDGPIQDVCDALKWVQTALPQLLSSQAHVQIDPTRVVAIGWSTGGHLAMTLAWTARKAGIKPPDAVLSFYAPTDFESGGKSSGNMFSHSQELDAKGHILELDEQRFTWLPKPNKALVDVLEALPRKPVSPP